MPRFNAPCSSIVAYDLNTGTIKWRAPLGGVRALAARGITDTGNAQRVHRNGLVVTAGGLIFVGTNADGTVRAYDKDTGTSLWSRELDANPEGMPAVFEVRGRSMWHSAPRTGPTCGVAISLSSRARRRRTGTTSSRCPPEQQLPQAGTNRTVRHR